MLVELHEERVSHRDLEYRCWFYVLGCEYQKITVDLSSR